MSSEISTTTVDIPCSTRSVTTPMPMFPAPSTPIRLNSMLRSLPPHDVPAPLTPQSGPSGGGSAVGVAGDPAQFGGEEGHGRTLEQADDGQILLELLFDRGNQLDCLQRRTAHLEEVLVRPDARPAQDALPNVQQRGLQRAGRCDVLRCLERLIPEPVCLDGLSKPLDVAQTFGNPLHGLRPFGNAESPSLSGRA